ncbi:MAG: Protein translocase subunit SecD [Candidatus Moranbacteria bacterium GW2011_GWC2_37_73]|nr:MAG: preprotein translocase subunit SecD, preprotein translocase subunit SecD [Parcubacteria group bacterium GW2011_GWC1_36_108]KKQ00640.1 MAG: Protein translocase subunit SecD [Candidatus Moranbacteria bacterium GW2011_GWD1_36_198]KKQ01928.1 MAG: Protein translocase subunit SecD [Candidatus Moranbacteria bacterium GW2011_GWD2_36_198]KKQ39481.1 MAG: Protein translocase subunit SecD [Candidatus Moranbacteria bacterium GW2011_GWC2_37_73]HAR99800.1 protein translocase subunit SecD [Candidatus M
MNIKKKLQLKFAGVIVLAVVAGLVAYPQAVSKITPLYDALNKFKLKLGLDLQGGFHLEYKADVSNIDPSKVAEAMEGAQTVIERRVNAFGVGEPLVQIAKSSGENRIIVELPGIKDIEEAKAKIKDAPLLEFKEEGPVDPQVQQMFDQMNTQAKEKAQKIFDEVKNGGDFAQLAKDNSEDPGSKDKGGDLDFVKKGAFVPEFDKILFESNLKSGEIYPDLVESQYGWHIIKFIESRGEGENLEVHGAHILFAKKDPSQYEQFKYQTTALTGKNLKSATAQYSNGQGLGEPEVSLQFDEEGTKLFAELTKKNLGKEIAIFLDGQLQIAPTVQVEITNGQAVITGNYTFKEAKDISDRLNQGALPVPLTLVGQQSVEATLGADSLRSILIAGAIGLGAVVVFMLIFYRFLGLVASLALLIYTAVMITIFKMTGITLTLSGIAGFVLSIGMAVDANILIFERTKEEIRGGRTIANSLEEGFKRAWTSIRDGNISSLLTAGILYLMGTGFVKGFAAALFIGVVVSMFTAVIITRTMLKVIISDWIHNRMWMVGVKKSDILD